MRCESDLQALHRAIPRPRPNIISYLGIVYYQQNNFQESLNTYKKG